MKRTVPKVTYRVETKFDKWSKYEEMLSPVNKREFRDLKSKVKNYRGAILESDESNSSIPILLSMIVQLKSELEDLKDRVQLDRIRNELPRGDFDVG